MIRIEVGYTDGDGKAEIEMIDAKSIDYVRIADDSGQMALLKGDEFYELCFSKYQAEPVLVYYVTERDVGKQLLLSRKRV
ncbi:MAG: hypothetical protein GWP10_18620 [Nitrospiraceae bacterium]|nr:hypothetical protein [Nitrospiraceae bacterium]